MRLLLLSVSVLAVGRIRVRPFDVTHQASTLLWLWVIIFKKTLSFLSWLAERENF